jgi:integrase
MVVDRPYQFGKEVSMIELVRLKKRPTYDGQGFHFFLEYKDLDGKRRRVSLGHANKRKAEKLRIDKEYELRMGHIGPKSMKLSRFWEKSKIRTRGQVRETTLTEFDTAMRQLIDVIGDMDYAKVSMHHGERFIQTCLDRGNTLATAQKKVKSLKRVFQVAMQRGQLEENPFQYLRCRKIPQKEIHVFPPSECRQLLNAAKHVTVALDYELLMYLDLTTGMRRGEILNLVWSDIDFEAQRVKVSPKVNTKHTWEWHIKDSERRILPLTDEVARRLAEHQEKHPEGYPYLFVPTPRYDHIQKLRKMDKWTVRMGRCPINNFNRDFKMIMKRAGVSIGEFHDLRRTCITQWFENGLNEFQVMKLAGHSDFSTTHRFYLAANQDLVKQARVASSVFDASFGTNVAQMDESK